LGFRFSRSVKILPGVRLNFSGSGISTSIGPRGATINIGKRGTRATVGLPGTGLSYSTFLSAARGTGMPRAASSNQNLGCVATIVAAVLGFIAIGQCTPSTTSTAPPSAVPTPIKLDTRYVKARSLNCRSSAAASAAIISKFAQGASVQVEEESGGWSRLGGAQPCWVSSSFLSTTAPPFAMGLLSDPAAAPDSEAKLKPASRASSSRGRVSHSSTPSRKSRANDSGGCLCSGSRVCVGPRGGRYCITSGGNKRYGV